MKILVVMLLLLVPIHTFAQDVLEPEQGVFEQLIICNQDVESITNNIDNRCDFNDLIEVGNGIINVVFQLSLALAVLVFLIVGARYMFAGSASGKTIAKQYMVKLAWGFAFILGSYLIVNTLFAIAGVDTAFKFIG